MADKRENIVIFPFMAQGHIIPFLALAFQIEQRGFNVIFVNTPRNIQKLRSSIPASSAIRLQEIPFDAVQHGLPAGAENTDVLPPHLIFPFIKSSLSLEPPFRRLISDLTRESCGSPPLCIVAREFGSFHAIFSGSSGFGLACYYSLWNNMLYLEAKSKEFMTLPDFPEAGTLHKTQLPANFLAADGNDIPSVFNRKNLPSWLNSGGMLCNSVEDLDKLGLDYFRRKLGRPVWAVGPLLLPGDNMARAVKQYGVTLEKCVEWLDAKPEKSVLLICFGSNNTISAERNFIWVVRPPLGFDINGLFRAEEWLPEGFIGRLVESRRRGLVVDQWAPQVQILSHRSVGAFMNHCGWNSALEALSRGVPLLGWPTMGDQFFNCKYLTEEIGVCVEVTTVTNLDVSHEDIKEKIDLVMGESERAMQIRKKAEEVKKIISKATNRDEGSGFKGSSANAMDDFLDAAFSMRTRNDTTNAHANGNHKQMVEILNI
ncbi:hypothetical protein NMG60_11033777 [Bertholletia excelsa]